MTYTLYKYTNTHNGKGYVGWTSSTVEDRWNRHVYSAMHGSKLLFHNAIRKYGTDCWEHQTLEIHETDVDVRAAEMRLIAEHKTFAFEGDSRGYNMTRGGEGVVGLRGPLSPNYGRPGPMRGRKHTLEAREKISAALRLRVPSEQQRQRCSESQRGRVFTEEHRRHLSESMTGRALSAEHKVNIGMAHRGMKRSEIARRNIAEGQKKFAHMPVERISNDGRTLTFADVYIAAQESGCRVDRIIGVITGACKLHGGFSWRFKRCDRCHQNGVCDACQNTLPSMCMMLDEHVH